MMRRLTRKVEIDRKRTKNDIAARSFYLRTWLADTIFHRIERCRFLSDFGEHRGESSRNVQSSTFYGIKAMSLVSKIIASVIWRPLPIFTAGAMLACLLTLKGPSHVSLP